ncbi:MAG: accessory factor UbiK family protein [Gammaproteobacteria bacterium]|nr:accessory factor UbiK family protein [Gammaproteobacteria bacterium]
MKDNNPFEDILKSLPDAAKQMKEEADKVGRTLLESHLKKADVVTRNEFEEQQAILKEALEKLAALEEKITMLGNSDNN